jgi:hypothetical protein
VKKQQIVKEKGKENKLAYFTKLVSKDINETKKKEEEKIIKKKMENLLTSGESIIPDNVVVNNNQYEPIANFDLNGYNINENKITSSVKSIPTFSPISSAISSPISSAIYLLVFSSVRSSSTSSPSISPSLSSLSTSISPQADFTINVLNGNDVVIYNVNSKQNVDVVNQPLSKINCDFPNLQFHTLYHSKYRIGIIEAIRWKSDYDIYHLLYLYRTPVPINYYNNRSLYEELSKKVQDEYNSIHSSLSLLTIKKKDIANSSIRNVLIITSPQTSPTSLSSLTLAVLPNNFDELDGLLKLREEINMLGGTVLFMQL